MTWMLLTFGLLKQVSPQGLLSRQDAAKGPRTVRFFK
jgi:hypothetical protein